jgi:hypothetical protein
MDFTKRLSDFYSYLKLALATKFHYFIIFAIICGIAITLIIGRPDFTIRAFIYIVPGILVSILLVKLYRKGEKLPDTLILIQANRKFFQIIFVSLFALSILALYFSSYRPWYYFLFITGLFSVIFLQIFHDSLKPSVILFEISCVMGNLIFGLQLKYPLFFGFTDIIPHLYFSKITLLSGHIIPEDLSYGYAWFPLYHIFIAEGTYLLGIDVKIAFIIVTSLSFIVLLWAIYLLFNQITNNNQTSLFMCLVFSTTPVVITYSTYVVTRVMAFFGLMFFLFLAHKQIQTSKWRSYSVLTILFSLYLILVHQVSILQILVVLFLFVMIEIIINDYFAIKTKIIAFIIVSFSTYWIFTSFFFTSIIVETADSTTIPGLSRLSSGVQFGNEYTFLMENVSTAIIIFFLILGIGYIFRAYKSKYPSVVGLLALITIPLFFPSPLTASSFAMVTLRIDRFQLLLSPFFAFVIAIGLLFALYSLHQNNYTRKIAIVICLLIFSYLSFSALTDNASDSLDLPSDQSRVYFSESEMNAFNFIPQFIEYNASISSDRFASRIFEQPFFSETKALALPSYYTYSTLASTDSFTFRDGFFILRNQILKEKGLEFESSVDYFEPFEPTPSILNKFSQMTSASQKIYDNQKVSILSNL